MNKFLSFFAILLANTPIDGFFILDDIAEILPNLSFDCRPDHLAETSVTCAKLLAHQIPQSAKLNDGYGLHLVPLASKYYFARKALALGAKCPASPAEPEKMDLYTPFNGLFGGQAHDTGYMGKKSVIVDCTFPTATNPFVCTGRRGNPGTFGTSLGTASYIPVLNDPSPTPDWQMFAQCWNWKSSKSPVSWNVFSKSGKLSKDHEALIQAKAAELGFKAKDTVKVNDFDQKIE